MKAPLLTRLFFSRWKLHAACALVCLLSCVPALWPRLPLAEEGSALTYYAGTLLLSSFCVSCTLMVLIVVHLLLRLRNKKAVLYLLAWCGQWALASLVFVLMAIAADVPPLRVAEATQPIQQTDTLHPASEELTGPAALVIPITPDSCSSEQVEQTPNLKLLEEKHERVLTEFLEASPRWAAKDDDTFYSRPGHVVMVPPMTGGTPGLVHVCFRRLVEGDPLPQGYSVVKSGEPFPKAPAGQEQVPDLALDLGRNHYLLLAWRGTSHEATAHKALNAAIAAVDSRMQELADSPTAETAAALNKGKLNMTGHTPELRLCEPPAQFGAYQAEIYANPHEPGTLLVYVRELESNRTLRILNCPAQYSENDNELFRHDLPGSVPLWMRDGGFSTSRHLFDPATPLFAIREGEPHRYFGVAFEVRFKPIDPRAPSRLILRRCYKVEAYEKPAPSEPRPAATKRTPDELTPGITLPAPQAKTPAALPSPIEEARAAAEARAKAEAEAKNASEKDAESPASPAVEELPTPAPAPEVEPTEEPPAPEPESQQQGEELPAATETPAEGQPTPEPESPPQGEEPPAATETPVEEQHAPEPESQPQGEEPPAATETPAEEQASESGEQAPE